MSRLRVMAWCAAAGAAVGVMSVPARAQLRVGQWNVTNYSSTLPSTRDAAFRTALYATAPNGTRFAPDILVIQEVVESRSGQTAQQAGNASVAAFLANLNLAAGSPGDWAAAPYLVNGGDTGNALFYRTSRVVLISTTALTTNTGTGSNQAPRDTGRWLVRPVGYTSIPAQLYIYGAHFKAGSTSADQLRRDPEGERIRIDANALPDDANFMLCGDLNVQGSWQTFYQYMVGNSGSPDFTADPSGRFFDPINTPGGSSSSTDWENSATYRFIHTQDPATAMDSRHDQILISGNLRDGQGMSYISSAAIGNILSAWDLNRFDDPNHSYRAWGNDGSSYNLALTVAGNSMVGPVIAQALVDSANGLGHLPVFVDLQVPARIAAPATVDFGTVGVGSTAQVTINVSNSADLALWSKDGTGRGIDTLNYSLLVTAGFTVAAGPFSDVAGGAANSHVITMNTASAGPKSGTLTITSDAPESPVLVIPITGTVGSVADYDVNDDGAVNIIDLYAWHAGNTDVDGNGSINAADRTALVEFLRAGEVADMTFGR